MNWFTVLRAILVRVFFATHGMVTIAYLYKQSGKTEYWYLASSVVGLLLESIVTFGANQGREWKWFCPSAFFYLLVTVPSTWFLELELVEWRIACNATYKTTDDALCKHRRTVNASAVHSKGDGDFLGGQDFEQTIRTLEQLLLLLLILGRWMLPKGKLTHDQLSQLLLVYIGTAADIVEFFEAFKEDVVKRDRALIKVILSIWTWSLLQFVLVITAQRARKDRSGLVTSATAAQRRPLQPLQVREGRDQGRAAPAAATGGTEDELKYCYCSPEVFGIAISMLLQDLPYLIIRLYMMFNYNTTSYTNIFFTLKNSLVCSLLTYRLVVIYAERFRQVRRVRKARLSTAPCVVLLENSDSDDLHPGEAGDLGGSGEPSKPEHRAALAPNGGGGSSASLVKVCIREKYRLPVDGEYQQPDSVSLCSTVRSSRNSTEPHLVVKPGRHVTSRSHETLMKVHLANESTM